MPRLLPPKEEGDFIFMGEALIVRRGGSSGGEVTIDGEKVNTKMSLKSIDLDRVYLEDCPYSSSHTASTWFNGEFHILGGHGGETRHYAFNGTYWRYVGETPINFYEAAAAVIDGKLHLIGSISSSANNMRHYSWDGASWSQLSGIEYGANNVCAVSVNNTLYFSTITKVYQWNGSTWNLIENTANTNYLLCEMDNELYAISQRNNSITSSSYYKAYLKKWNGTSFESISTIETTGYNIPGAAILTYNNEIHLFGGSGGSDYSQAYRHLWWNGSEWAEKEALPFYFRYGIAFELDGIFHLLQGLRKEGDQETVYKDHSILADKFYIEQYVENEDGELKTVDLKNATISSTGSESSEACISGLNLSNNIKSFCINYYGSLVYQSSTGSGSSWRIMSFILCNDIAYIQLRDTSNFSIMQETSIYGYTLEYKVIDGDLYLKITTPNTSYTFGNGILLNGIISYIE